MNIGRKSMNASDYLCCEFDPRDFGVRAPVTEWCDLYWGVVRYYGESVRLQVVFVLRTDDQQMAASSQHYTLAESA